VALNAYARSATDRVVLPIARCMVRLGVTANWLTFAGLVGNAVGVAVILGGQAFLGAAVLSVACLTDAFDGTVARLRGSSSAFGSFYDSVADRGSDAIILGAAAWLVRDDPLLFAVAVVALAAAQLTSYIRAKAESLGWDATVGLIERPERLIIIIIGFGYGLLVPALWLLAVGGLVTIAQRFRAVLRQAPST
jgi:CDP-diacylglycerol--glycerol-3-phosphate 3-phosphatidyltransferase